MKKQRLAMMMSAVLLAPAAVMAQGWYAGGGLGDSEVEDVGGDDTSFKLFGGYRLSERVAVEAAYHDFGDYNERSVSAEAEALSLSVVGMLPLNPQWSLFARGGLARTSTDVRVGSWHESDDDFSLAVGLGVTWLVTPQIELRADYELIDQVSFGGIDDGDIETVGIGAAYRF